MLKVSTVNIEAGLSVPWNGRVHIHRSSAVSTEASRRAIKSFYVVYYVSKHQFHEIASWENPSIHLKLCPSAAEDNILTKYQMIKFIDFCEVWLLPESVARVAAIAGDHRCHAPRYSFKDTLDEFLGYSRPSSFHTLPRLIWCGS
ncbi:uncharacterized protein TNCV_4734911 [Trichonephila clavipes]|nr:uncharacterized protein TNCV_4734911 [Trichonephila clavipes]